MTYLILKMAFSQLQKIFSIILGVNFKKGIFIELKVVQDNFLEKKLYSISVLDITEKLRHIKLIVS